MARICVQRVPRQTWLGVFQNLWFPGDCGGIKYISMHLGQLRVTLTWKG